MSQQKLDCRRPLEQILFLGRFIMSHFFAQFGANRFNFICSLKTWVMNVMGNVFLLFRFRSNNISKNKLQYIKDEERDRVITHIFSQQTRRETCETRRICIFLTKPNTSWQINYNFSSIFCSQQCVETWMSKNRKAELKKGKGRFGKQKKVFCT